MGNISPLYSPFLKKKLGIFSQLQNLEEHPLKCDYKRNPSWSAHKRKVLITLPVISHGHKNKSAVFLV